MNTFLISTASAAAMILAGITVTMGSDGRTPGKALSMIEIVQRLEHEGYGPFTELSMDGRNWEVEARKRGESLELNVDAVNGTVLSEHRDDPEAAPADDAMMLSKVLQSVVNEGNYEFIDEVSFERRYWEVEVFKNGQKRELHVDPNTATIIADRIDD